MNSQNVAFGTTIAIHGRSSSQTDDAERYIPETLKDLLEQIENVFPHEPLGMLKATAGHFADFVGVPIGDLTVDSIDPSGYAFSRHLTTKRYKDNSIHSYRNYYQRLLKLAMELGWAPKPSVAEIAWKSVLGGIKLPPGCNGVVQFSVAMGISPNDLSEPDLESWIRSMVERGRGYDYVTQRIWFLRRTIATSGIAHLFPNLLPHHGPDPWATPVEQMPDPCVRKSAPYYGGNSKILHSADRGADSIAK